MSIAAENLTDAYQWTDGGDEVLIVRQCGKVWYTLDSAGKFVEVSS